MLGLAQTPTPAPNVTDANGHKQGQWVRLWAGSDQVRYAGAFKDDRPVGRFIYYSTDGRVESVIAHYASSDASHALHYHPGGRLMAEGRYVGEKKDSIWNYYDEHGGLRSRERYVRGVMDGEQTTYFSDGSAAEVTHFKNGKEDGEHVQYFANGQVRHRAMYSNGEPEGEMTWYYPDGKREIAGTAVNGMREGSWFYYNKDGTVQMQSLYQGGELIRDKRENGTFTDYYDDERPEREETYAKGLLEGPFMEWYDNGEWVDEPLPADPKLGRVGASDERQRVLKGQTKKRDGTYLHGELNGKVRTYDERGVLVLTEEYANGRRISSGP